MVWDFVELNSGAILEIGLKEMGLCNAFCSDLLESPRGAAPNSVGQTTSTKSTSRELKHTSLQNALHNPPGVSGGGIKKHREIEIYNVHHEIRQNIQHNMK